MKYYNSPNSSDYFSDTSEIDFKNETKNTYKPTTDPETNEIIALEVAKVPYTIPTKMKKSLQKRDCNRKLITKLLNDPTGIGKLRRIDLKQYIKTEKFEVKRSKLSDEDLVEPIDESKVDDGSFCTLCDHCTANGGCRLCENEIIGPYCVDAVKHAYDLLPNDELMDSIQAEVLFADFYNSSFDFYRYELGRYKKMDWNLKQRCPPKCIEEKSMKYLLRWVNWRNNSKLRAIV